MFLVCGMFTSLGLYLQKTDTVFLSPASFCLQRRSHSESKERGSMRQHRRCLEVSSAGEQTHSITWTQIKVRGCISCLEINWFFHFLRQKKTANKWQSWSARVTGYEEGKMFIFIPLSPPEESDDTSTTNGDHWGKNRDNWGIKGHPSEIVIMARLSLRHYWRRYLSW